MTTEQYNIEEHIHRYAVWTAARATSTSRFANGEIAKALEQIELKKKLEALRRKKSTGKTYRVWFIKETNGLIKTLNKISRQNAHGKMRKVSFGIAAKILSIYIKTVEVLPSCGKSNLAQVAYPPIDSILLKNIRTNEALSIASTAWSKMNEHAFLRMMDDLIKFSKDQGYVGLWQLEEYWITD